MARSGRERRRAAQLRAGVGQTKPVAIGVWIDGAMPQRAETIRGYVQGMHLLWLSRTSPGIASVCASNLAWVSANWLHPPRSSCATATTPTSRAWWRWCRR